MPRSAFHPDGSTQKPCSNTSSRRSGATSTCTSTRPSSSNRRRLRRRFRAALPLESAVDVLARDEHGVGRSLDGRAKHAGGLRSRRLGAARAARDRRHRRNRTALAWAAGRTSTRPDRRPLRSPRPRDRRQACARSSATPGCRRAGAVGARPSAARPRVVVTTTSSPAPNAGHQALNQPGRANGGAPTRSPGLPLLGQRRDRVVDVDRHRPSLARGCLVRVGRPCKSA